MENKTSVKDFFINLGAIVALYTTVGSLINLLFNTINSAYPQITNGYNYFGNPSISWSVATLIIFFPIFILLMWLLERDYRINPEKQTSGIHRWLTYITLFIAGLTIAGDLITVLYYFIDGQELTTGFILKVLVLLVIASAVFSYYLSDVLGKLTSQSRIFWRIIAGVVVVGSIVWGFSVLGSPRTQQLLKYDQQKINDLMNLVSQVESYYATNNKLPNTLNDITLQQHYPLPLDGQLNKDYEYKKITPTQYELCAEFNKASTENKNNSTPALRSPYDISWVHSAGRNCFTQTINPNLYNQGAYPKPVPFR